MTSSRLTLRKSITSLCNAYHFALHGVIQLGPCFLQLWSERRTELLFQAPDEGLAERNEMRWLRSELRVLTARMEDERLEQLTLVECADDGGDHVHQLEVLAFQVGGEQTLCVGSKLEEPAVERSRELPADRPYRVERSPDQCNLLGRHEVTAAGAG
jgi:hypothetical protein